MSHNLEAIDYESGLPRGDSLQPSASDMSTQASRQSTNTISTTSHPSQAPHQPTPQQPQYQQPTPQQPQYQQPQYQQPQYQQPQYQQPQYQQPQQNYTDYRTMDNIDSRYDVNEERRLYYDDYESNHLQQPGQQGQNKVPIKERMKSLGGKAKRGAAIVGQKTKKGFNWMKCQSKRAYQSVSNQYRSNPKKVIIFTVVGVAVITGLIIYMSGSGDEDGSKSVSLKTILTFDNCMWICVFIIAIVIMCKFNKQK